MIVFIACPFSNSIETERIIFTATYAVIQPLLAQQFQKPSNTASTSKRMIAEPSYFHQIPDHIGSALSSQTIAEISQGTERPKHPEIFIQTPPIIILLTWPEVLAASRPP